MIKFTATTQKGHLVGLGLSRLNCELLLAGQPIVVDARKLGLPFALDILICGGETEFAIQEELERQGFDLPTDPNNIHIDPKLGG